jgi:hypothetical protein
MLEALAETTRRSLDDMRERATARRHDERHHER